MSRESDPNTNVERLDVTWAIRTERELQVRVRTAELRSRLRTLES